MPKKGEKLPPAHRAAVSAALKGRKQSPEHVKARFDGLAKVRAATVRVSKNDAAYLQVARQCHDRILALRDERASIAKDLQEAFNTKSTRDDAANLVLINSLAARAYDAEAGVDNQLKLFNQLQQAWADGENVMLAKLSR